jgi:outer membrane protein assembly factor BamD (BamD/ComL family)
MRNIVLLAWVVGGLAFAASPVAMAQGVRSGPDPSTLRDPELEKDSQHNLEVARNYFRLKKAYVAALSRLEEVIAGNPTFSKIDEVLWMAGQSSLFLAEKKGKQNPSQYKRSMTPEEFREKGRGYLVQLVNAFPESTFRKQAEEELRSLDPAKP